MDEQKGLFGFLDKYLMGPMSIIAQYKVVRAITAAGMAVVPFTIVGSMVLVLVFYRYRFLSCLLSKIFLQLPLISLLPYI